MRDLNVVPQFKSRVPETPPREVAELQSALNEHAIIVIADLEGKITFANDNFCALSKYSREELLDHYIVNPSQHPLEFVSHLWMTVARGLVWRGEIRNKTKDGAFCWLDTTIVPSLDECGKPRQFVAICTDVTERKRTEAALRESEERFRALVTASSDVVYQMNPDWTEMRHLRGRDFIPDTTGPSDTWLDRYIHPKDQPLVLDTIREAIQTKSIFALEHQVRLVDGGLGWTFSRAVPLLDVRGEIVEWFGAASDITARKLAESKLQAQLARLNLLNQITRAISERQDVQSISQVVIRTVEEHLPADFCCLCLYDQADGTLKITQVGIRSEPMAMELARAGQSKMPINENGLSGCARGQLIYEPDIAEMNHPLLQRLAQGGLRALVAAPLLVEGKVFAVLISARRVPDSFSSGECEFLQQLSEHVALASNQSQLHGALQQAYDDLRQTQQAIMQQERLKALGQMASGIAHDINNAISPVALYTESLLEREPGLSSRARDYLTTIQRAIEDVSHTVARMREFYRQPEQPQLALTPVELNSLVQQVIDLSRARWSDMPQQRGVVIKLETALAPKLPVISGVESEIREALINLIFNAVDAMPEGGTLKLRTGVSPDGRLVFAEVRDTGIGMNEDTRRRCLEPFFTTKGERGTGLGLAMVYGIARRHNADIEIESAPGKGTTMRINFPAVTTPALGAKKAPGEFATPSRLHVLIIDDDPLLIKSLRDTLEADGHLIVTASSGQEGIAAFHKAKESERPFAVVITDLGMPYMDGRQVAAMIKNISPVTPVILLTGWGQRLAAEGDAPAHVDQILNKPPKLRELREALAQCLSKV